MPDDTFYVWTRDDIDSSFYEETDEPRPLYVCMLCRDTDDGETPHLTRGYDPRDGIFERPGIVIDSLGGIDVKPPDPYALEVERELMAEFESRREAVLVRGEN